MLRLFTATAVSMLLVAGCSDSPGSILDPGPAPAANHVPGEPTYMHSVGVQVNGSIATVIWHVDPFNVGEGYTVEVYAGSTCSGVNLVPGGAAVAGTAWTEPLHLYVNAGPLMSGEYCARVKSNGLFSPVTFQTFITVHFGIGSANSPPEAGIDAPAEALEGQAVTFVSVAADPDGDPLSLAWSIDGDPVSTAPSFTHVFPDDGVYQVMLTVDDGNGGTSVVTGSVDVKNVAPAMMQAKTAAVAEAVVVPVNTAVEFSGVFSDPGTLDTHTLELDCGPGGAPLPGVAVQPDYTGACSWSAAGTYRVQVTIRDDDGGADTRVSDPIVVYVPGKGGVTGGGWFESTAGACRLTPACALETGKASIGFVSKYGNGALAPKGDLTFTLMPAGIVFKSTTHDWLSIDGAVARLSGTGRINGSGRFDFLLITIDGRKDGSGIDRIRILIRDPASGLVVYDNRPGADPYGTEASEISGGSVVIHNGH